MNNFYWIITISNEAKDHIQHIGQFIQLRVEIILLRTTSGNTYVNPAPTGYTTRVESAGSNLIGRTTGTTGGATTFTTGVPATTTFTTGGSGAGYGANISTGSPVKFGTVGATTGATNYAVTTGNTGYGVTTGTTGYGVTTGRASGANVKFGYTGAPATQTYTTTTTAPVVNSYNTGGAYTTGYTHNTGNAIISKPVDYRVGAPITGGTYTTTEGKFLL